MLRSVSTSSGSNSYNEVFAQCNANHKNDTFLWTSSTHMLCCCKYSTFVDSIDRLLSQYLSDTIQLVPVSSEISLNLSANHTWVRAPVPIVKKIVPINLSEHKSTVFGDVLSVVVVIQGVDAEQTRVKGTSQSVRPTKQEKEIFKNSFVNSYSP